MQALGPGTGDRLGMQPRISRKISVTGQVECQRDRVVPWGSLESPSPCQGEDHEFKSRRDRLSSGGASLAVKHAVVTRARPVRVRRLPSASLRAGSFGFAQGQALQVSGRRGGRSPRVAWDHEIGGSNPPVPTYCLVAQW